MVDTKTYKTCNEPFLMYVDGIMKNKNYSYNQLLAGICTQKEWITYVNEDRFISVLLVKRILERLGESPAYYDYLAFGAEYDKWKSRMEILLAIDNEQFERAGMMLDTYDCTGNKLEYQFCLMMRAVIIKHGNFDRMELLSVYKEAAQQTIPDGVDVQLEKMNTVLSVQEVNVLLEYDLNNALKAAENLRENDFVNYYNKINGILQYIKKIQWSNDFIAQIYPKAVFYLLCLEKMQHREIDVNIGNFGDTFYIYNKKIEKCNEAIEILANSERSCYLAELLDMRKYYIDKLQKIISRDIFDKFGFAKIMSQTEKMQNIQTYIEKLCGVCSHMKNDIYMYVETSVFRLEEAVISRRKAMGMSQAALAEGICDTKTVGRFERGEHIPRTYILYGILRRVKLYSNFVVGGIVAFSSTEYDTIHSIDLLISQERFDEALACLYELKENLDMSYEKNKQTIEKNENIIFLRKGMLSRADYLKQIKRILGYTIEYSVAVKTEELYLTSDELLLIQNMLSVNYDADNMGLMQKICNYYENVSELLYANRYRLFSATIASRLGNDREFEKSDEIFKNVIVINTKLKGLGYTARCIYGLWWNKDAQNKSSADEKQTILDMCITLSEFLGDMKFIKFFKNKKTNEY